MGASINDPKDSNKNMKYTLLLIIKWLIAPLVFLALASIILYWLTEPKSNKDWKVEHALLANIKIQGDKNNPHIEIENIRDFQWEKKDKVAYKKMQFQLDNIVSLKVGVSHFSAISEIAHVFLIVVLENGEELGISIEARREKDEDFTLHGGLLAKFELIYVLATSEDLIGIRKINKEALHIYPIKATKEKAQELFMLLANDSNAIQTKPRLYHLFFRNCTNQLVKRVSILTKQKYPWYFQTLAPGNTAKILYQQGLIDLPDTGFDDIKAKSLVKETSTYLR